MYEGSEVTGEIFDMNDVHHDQYQKEYLYQMAYVEISPIIENGSEGCGIFSCPKLRETDQQNKKAYRSVSIFKLTFSISCH